ncbi:MAG: carboxypeptidase regulatory-like domain-containing protein [Acidobacteria bacterium]|nr:carboxypeptidase regulatory-like domain-containing protein [Acidobacteriota bacterium]
MRAIKALVLSVSIVALLAPVRPGAVDAVVRGVVGDAGGRPIAGALVKANAGTKSVSRYTGPDGRYELTLAPGTYDVAAEAFGFRMERRSVDTAAAGPVNFSMSPGWSVTQFTGADIDQLVPDDHAGRLLKSTCINCHSLDVMLRRRGSTAAQWRAYVEKQMQLRIGRGPYTSSEAEWTELTGELERIFGPKARYFGPGAEPPAPAQVRRPAMAPEVARATFYEYTLPNPRSMPHSLAVDPAGRVWISGWDSPTNAVIRFDTATEQFRTYPVPTPDSTPHTPCVTRDGRVWMALNARGTAKAAVIDPRTNELVEITWDAKAPGTHNCQEDRDGNVWFASLGESDEGFYVYNPKTAQFRSYKYPLPSAYPDGAKALRDTAEGDPVPSVRAGLYDAKVDSTGRGWGVAYSMGMIVSVNPKTGETREYFPPDTPHLRGVFVDSRDTVWFAAFGSHKIGRLDPKTGQMKLYQPPTLKAAPYSFAEDRRRGVIWFGDLNGNNLTSFDPRTERFVEYPFPSRNVNPRLGIGIDPRGRIWFTEFLNGRIGTLDPGDAPPAVTSSR